MSDVTVSARGTLKLPRGRRWTLYAVLIGVWATGVAWLFYHYFMRVPGRFGMRAHPLEVWWLRVHAAFSFWAIWALGLLWGVHIVRGWTLNWRRWSGGSTAGAGIILVLTGYGLYYITDEDWRARTSVIHWAIGLAALVVFLIHWLSKSRPRRT